MITGQHVSLLLAIVCYAVATGFCVGAIADEKKRRVTFAVILLAFLAHSSALGLRWLEAGRLPGLGLYEVTLGYTWVGSFVFLLVLIFDKRQFGAGLAAMPMLALGMIMAFFIREAPPLAEPYFYSFWFYSHTLTAYLAFGFILCGTALGVVLLLKEKAKEKGSRLDKFLPTQSVTDFLSWRLLGVGFFFLGLMIVSGGCGQTKPGGVTGVGIPLKHGH